MYDKFRILSLCIAAIPVIWMFLRLSRSDRSTLSPSVTLKNSAMLKLYELLSKYCLIILALIFMVFLFSRLFHLSSIPAGIHLDEIGVTYDAFSLKNFGTDRAGAAYPVYPSNYGDGNSALYTYLEMLLLYFLPFSLITVRLPAVIIAIPCFFASFGIVYELYEDRVFSLLGPVFVTITPYFFTSERFGLDCNLMLSVSTVALYFLIKATKESRGLFYFLAGIVFGITLYTYILSYLMLPVFYLLMVIYLLFIRKIKIRELSAFVIPFGLLGIPLFLEQLVNMGILPEFHFFLSDFQKLPDYRIGEISIKNIPGNLSLIIKLLFGGDSLGFNALYEFGPLYWCCIPVIILGFISALKKIKLSFKDHEVYPISIIMFFGLSIYSVALLLTGFNTYNSNAIYIVFIMLAIEGIDYTVKARVSGSIRLFVLVSAFAMLFVSFILFSEFYFRRQTAVYGFHAVFVSTEPGDIVKYADNNYNPANDKTIYTEINYSERDYADLLIALYTETDPAEWRRYEAQKQESPEDAMLNNIAFHFPEEFDEDEDAIYILGTDWNHISSYLKDTGFDEDTGFPGYTILYRTAPIR
ncbi:MAG: glycosyltransferase family 39 protein [Lachnospiraceae bacterium]|nr:glycosyltransferase family 39 protein [Lachnospiraceae bacterium]